MAPRPGVSPCPQHAVTGAEAMPRQALLPAGLHLHRHPAPMHPGGGRRLSQSRSSSRHRGRGMALTGALAGPRDPRMYLGGPGKPIGHLGGSLGHNPRKSASRWPGSLCSVYGGFFPCVCSGVVPPVPGTSPGPAPPRSGANPGEHALPPPA
ncbi:hypothetical protein GWK47_053535 [Chionoecetes opilio]|uniref:Uncharacterized protein n=1 Tax=Chionoecetes opilio TaxID=41210 RepID=A0A8J5C918_CHIOP|nr:hypothetical protein GWK47_053535 [Chionoecetes opilio]